MLPYVLFEASSYTLKVPLLPKLRGQFAEFLNDGSLEGLGTFIPVYLCWFAVRSSKNLINEAFLGSIESTEFYEANFIVLSPLSSNIKDILTSFIHLQVKTHDVRCVCSVYLSASPLRVKQFIKGAGIFTSCPSTSPFGYALGPTNPTSINVA